MPLFYRELTNCERELIEKISSRSANLAPYGRWPELNYSCILSEVHLKICPIDLGAMLRASDEDLVADLSALRGSLDWVTLTLANGYRSKCSK